MNLKKNSLLIFNSLNLIILGRFAKLNSMYALLPQVQSTNPDVNLITFVAYVYMDSYSLVSKELSYG